VSLIITKLALILPAGLPSALSTAMSLPVFKHAFTRASQSKILTFAISMKFAFKETAFVHNTLALVITLGVEMSKAPPAVESRALQDSACKEEPFRVRYDEWFQACGSSSG
jgi:hypothetical protein